MSSNHYSEFPLTSTTQQSDAEPSNIRKADFLAMSVSGKPSSHAFRKPNALDPRKALTIRGPPSPQVRGVCQRATVPGPGPGARDDKGTGPDRCLICHQFKQRGQACPSCSQKAYQKDAQIDEWSQQYVSMQFGLLSELGTKTGRKYEDIRKQLKSGTPKDIMEAHARIEKEIRYTEKARESSPTPRDGIGGTSRTVYQ